MDHITDSNHWVYVVVQNPGNNESLVGQHDSENNIFLIPVFRDKETALQGLARLAQEPGKTLEIQAIIYGDLLKYAQRGGFLLFFLDGNGRILTKMGPDGRPL
ncbi:MAG: hypothetical protein C4519_10270 [Desulfobacteraceae bacterium]|nr:MAG: hypothetical protein C4519_10270 [Desulfobacteraceae bacterium]